ncbi:GIY-YIG nuclease family protein [Flavobacterium aquiphilum]|uniref:GIY-YIG nuclease family protein n=1 Tax=Flavobacterium aquiphilum TaxID=3003261 RepID=UPI00247FE71E|nr:GIY-YIG nuclease family protein [Flavobacterium aquiphilum]
MAKSLDDIFNDDDFGLLESKEKQHFVRTDEDRLIDSFEEINMFFEKNKREPSTSSMSEYSLCSRLKEFRNNEQKKAILKAFDRFNLLGAFELKMGSIDDILNDDTFGLLEDEGDTSIFEFKYTPKGPSRANADYIAQRKSMNEREFKKYELMFQQVHKDLKEGKRKLLDFTNAEDNLIEGNFYLVDGILAYLEVSNAEKILKENKSGDRIRLEGRTVTVFENGTVSNMLFRSLGKAIQKNGKIITNRNEDMYNQLQQNFGAVGEEDIQSGWIYVLKSKSENPEIKKIEHLYKIGFSKNPIKERIKNASNEATYLFADVEIVASYNCYSLNVQAFESLLHRFFAEVCLNIDLYHKSGNRFIPREWFKVPLIVIDEVIELILNQNIVNYKYDFRKAKIILK